MPFRLSLSSESSQVDLLECQNIFVDLESTFTNHVARDRVSTADLQLERASFGVLNVCSPVVDPGRTPTLTPLPPGEGRTRAAIPANLARSARIP